LLAVLISGCRDQAPVVEGGVYDLTVIDDAELPSGSIAAVTLTLGSDHQFARAEQDTLGAISIDLGTWYAVGPIELERVFLEFNVENSSGTWHATSEEGGRLLSLQRNSRVEKYRLH